MKVGFTGSRKGMTLGQKDILCRSLIWATIQEFHHGDCIGADEEAHNIVREYAPRCSIIVHPPIDRELRALTKGNITYEPQHYLKRNHDIVDLSDMLIACPKENHEVQRSGTWATIRYAKNMNKPVMVIMPDGKIVR